MKRLSIILASVLMCTAPLCAKTASELRIYINPGHGSYTGNDRPQNTYREVNGARKTIKPESATDTTGFYESNTNLYKGFGMLEELINFGFSFDRSKGARNLTNNLVMSRVKSGPGDGSSSTTYNRNLSEIAAEAENNNFDMFLSIHSDAATANSTTNRPLGLYRGHDTPKAETGCALAYQKTSRAIITALWSHCTGIKHQNFSSTATSYIRGDWDFYGSHTTVNGYAGYLGVLKSGVVGGLYEGYCHTYGPSRHRALNFDVDRVEGIGYARGTAEYFGVSKSGKGLIYGIIRTQSQQFSDTYYVPRSGTNDVYMPINGATVTLMNSLGQVLQTKTTDNNYNGAFVFLNLDPGTYVINIAKSGYTSVNKTVTVAANVNTYPEIFLTPGSGSSTEEPGVVAGTETYPDPANEAGIKAQSSYEFEQEYVDHQISELAGYTIKRLIADGNYLYILGLNGTTPKVVVYDHTKKQVVSTPGTSGCTGNYYVLSDIALTADKVLIGINKVDQAFSSATEGNVSIYKWSNNSSGLPTGNPIVWISSSKAGNWNNGIAAETMAYSGTTQNGHLIYSGVNNNSTSTTGWRNVHATISNGAVSSHFHDKWNQNALTITDPRFFASPWNEDRFIFNASSQEGLEIKGPSESAGTPTTYESMTSGTVNAKCFHTGMFRYGGKAYMVVHTYVSGTTDSKKIRLVDITNGFTSAAEVTCTGNVITQASAAGELTAGTTVVDRNSSNQVIDARIALFAMRGDAQLTKLVMPKKNEVVDDPNIDDPSDNDGVNLTEYAYDLSSVATGNVNEYTVNYKVTGDAVSATLVLTPTEAGYSQVERIELPSAEEGDHSYTFSVNNLPAHSYSWAVEIKSKSNKTGACAYEEDDSDATVGARGGVVVITDPEQPSFGYAAVSYGKAGGVDIYAPDRTRIHQKLFKNDPRFSTTNGSSMFRGDQLDGKAVFVDWSDVGSGYWQLDLLNPTDITDIMIGSKDSKGAHIVNGSSIGGGSSCVAFQYPGTNNLRMYTFAEDYPSGNQPYENNYVYRYDLGANRTITTAPAKRFDNLRAGEGGILANAVVEIVATDKGFFCSQLRSSGQNLAGVPGFIFVDNDGNILLNSASLPELVNGCAGGIAINREQNLFAVKCYTSNIILYDVAWNGNTPVFTHKATIPSIAGATFDHIRFDYAGNLYDYNGNTDNTSKNLNGNFKIYAMPTVNPVVSTPARAQFEIVREDLPTTVGIAGAFNNWNANANVTADLTDNCGEITVNNWSNTKAGQDAGFKIVVSTNGTTAWYGASSVNAEGWTTTSTDGGNMTLPASCEGKNIKFTIAADNGNFNYVVLNPDPVVTVGIAGDVNSWNTTANVTGDIVDNCGEITIDNWTNGTDGFKVIVTTNGNVAWYGASEVSTEGWTETSTSGDNMYLPTKCEGKTVIFTIAADNGHFSYEVLGIEPDPDPVDFNDTIDKMTEVWTFSETNGLAGTADVNHPWAIISGSGQTVRDAQFLDGKLYTANNTASNSTVGVSVVNPANGALIKTLNVNGISGGRIALGGLSSIGGKLIASNSATTTQALKVYKWADDDSAPELWFTDESTHGDVTLGDQINTTGDLNDGYIWFSNAAKVVRYKVTNGTVNTTPEVITLKNGLATVNGSADVSVLPNGMFWVSGKDTMPMLYNPDGSLVGTLSIEIPAGANANYFKQGTSVTAIPFGNRDYLAITGYLGSANSLLKGTIAIIDVTDAMSGLGISRASSINGNLIGIYPEAGLSNTARNTQFQTAVTYQLTNNDTKLDVAGVVCLQGATMVTFDGVNDVTGVELPEIEQVAAPAVYYNLQGVRVDNPAKGIYIKVTGDKTQKVLIK